MARRLRDLGPDIVHLIVGELAAQIRRFPWRRRSRAVAANLLLDTEAAVCQGLGHRLSAGHGRRELSLALIRAILAIGILALAGLVIDGGGTLAARGEAADLAEQAARAGTAAITSASRRRPSPAGLRIDPSAARRPATQVLTAGHATGEVTVSGCKVTVTAHVSRHATLLAAFGVSDLSAQATATATLLRGITAGRSG